MILIVIPTKQPERYADLIKLQKQLINQDMQFIIIPHQDGLRPSDNYIRSLEVGYECTKSGDYVLQMDDDVYLCNDFSSIINTVLSDNQYDVISFYRNDKLVKKKGIYKHSGTYFGNQCLAYKRELIPAFIDYHKEFDKEDNGWLDAPDVALGQFCKKMGHKIWTYHPSIVQHRDVHSLIGNGTFKRQSESFRRVYGEIND